MPQTSKFIRRFGQTHYHLAMSVGGESESSLGHTAEALLHIEQAIALYNQALALDPDDVKAKNLKVQSLLERADLQRARGQTVESNSSLNEAETIFDSVVGDNSSDRRQLAVWIGFARSARLAAEQKAVEALKALDAVEVLPEEADHQRIRLARARSALLIQDGEFESAQLQLDNVLPIASESYNKQPGNPIVVQRYVTLLMDLADLQQQFGNYPQALELNLQVVGIQQVYADNNPDDSYSKYNLASATNRLAGSYLLVNQQDKRRESAAVSLQLYREILQLSPDSPDSQRNLVVALLGYGSALSDAKEFTQAEKYFAEAEQILEKLVATGDRPLATKQLQAESYYNRGMLHFNRLMQGGEQITDIEQEPDFKAVLADLGSAIDTLNTLEQQGELTYQQASFRDNAIATRQLILDMAEKIKSLDDNTHYE
jgi:tetratricopeptide (TPR) repeat protein